MHIGGKWKTKLSDVFNGVTVKRLTAVEVNPKKSNQHEFNGINKFRHILGDEMAHFEATFLYLSDNSQISIKPKEKVGWYDSRKDQPKRSAEWRLYYPASADLVTSLMSVGDLFLLGKKKDDTLLIVVAEKDSTIESQLLWLFHFPDQISGKEFRVTEHSDRDLDFIARSILEFLEIEIESDDTHLEDMLLRFGGVFPPTRIFSKYAREKVPDVDAVAFPDSTLITWLEKEEQLFRALERHLVSERLTQGFATSHDVDVDGFVAFSLSVQNRRKARAGASLENHIESVLMAHKLKFCREGITENRSKPDFLFPGVEEYANDQFDPQYLALLGAKSSCKDRWRQVLSEGKRIKRKHLLTLEPSISEKQTDEMMSNNLQLVVPDSIQTTYKKSQQEWLLSFQDFIAEIKSKQEFHYG